MEIGANALIHGPSLWALLPLLVYIVLIFLNVSNLKAIMLGIIVGAILLGQDLGMLGGAFATSLGSFVAMIGLIIMLGAGLGKVMNAAGVTETIVYWVVKGMKVDSQNKARLAIMVISILICGLLGTLGGGNAIIAPILIPVLARVGLTPTTSATVLKNAGIIGLLWGPLTAVTLTTMELTQMSYLQYMLVAGLPFGIIWLIGTWIASKYTQKETEGKEKYNLTELKDIDDIKVTSTSKNATIAFIVTFIILVAYGMIKGIGSSYAIIVELILIFVVALFGKVNPAEAEKELISGVASMAELFLIFVTIDVLLNMVTVGGGFDAMANILQTKFKGINPSFVMLLSSIVGSFGIEAAAVAELKIINDMFLPMVTASGLPLQMFAISLMSATQLTGSIYPTADMIGQMGIARSSNMKVMLKGNWIAMIPVVLYIIIWSFVGLSFFK